jgi:DNA-binding MarR family transcriptional regulator
MSNIHTNSWKVRSPGKARVRAPSRGADALRGLLFAARVLAARAPAARSSTEALGRWPSEKQRVLRHLADRGPRPVVELPLGWLVARQYSRALVDDLVKAGLVETQSGEKLPTTVVITVEGRNVLRGTARSDFGVLALEHTTLSADELEQATAVLAEVARAIA